VGLFGLKPTGVAACVVVALAAASAAATQYPIPPVQGKNAVSKHVSGKVTVRRSKHAPAVPLQSGASVPNGSEVNATNGTVVLTVRQRGKLRKVSITGGEFIFNQNRHTGNALFTLALSLTGCPSFRPASEQRAAAARARKRPPRKRRGPRSRQITVSDSGGSFGSQGQYVATSTEGTRWRTADACGTSTVTVYSGRVRVKNLVTGRQVTISAGQHYTANK
jgi:hypothetical protein